MEDVLIHFRLVGDEAKALRELSTDEFRRPRDQARLILRERLEQLGLLEPTVNRDAVRVTEGQRAGNA